MCVFFTAIGRVLQPEKGLGPDVPGVYFIGDSSFIVKLPKGKSFWHLRALLFHNIQRSWNHMFFMVDQVGTVGAVEAHDSCSWLLLYKVQPNVTRFTQDELKHQHPPRGLCWIRWALQRRLRVTDPQGKAYSLAHPWVLWVNSGHLWRHTPNPYWVNFPAALGHFLLANGPGFAPLSQHLLFLSSKCIYKSSGPSWAITRRSLTPTLIAKPWLGCYFSPPLFFFKGKCLRRCFFSPLYRKGNSKWYSCPSHLSHLMGVTQLSFSSEAVPVTSRIILHIRKWACDVTVKVWQ